MKIKIILAVILLLSSCTTQPAVAKNWFPDDIKNLYLVDEYINNFSTDNIDTARGTYFTVLAFIGEVIAAGHENLARASRLDSPTVKRGTLIDGQLAIVESTEMANIVPMWDDIREERTEVAACFILWEFVLIFEYSKLHNELLEYWQSLTGELLGEYLDTDILWDKLEQDYAPLLEPRWFEIF